MTIDDIAGFAVSANSFLLQGTDKTVILKQLYQSKSTALMRHLLTLLLVITITQLDAQQQVQPGFSKKELNELKRKIGIKAGYNFAKVNGTTTNFSPGSNNGFIVAGFFAPGSKGIGYRTEIVFSRQGFSFDESGKMEEVSQDYIYMPHLTTFTIADRVQLQAGGQIGYLLSAKKSSSAERSSQVTDYMNRLDYGFAGGIEIYPFKGLLVGGRYNLSFGNIYKTSAYSTASPTPYPLPFNPNDVKGKNAVVQFFAGYRF